MSCGLVIIFREHAIDRIANAFKRVDRRVRDDLACELRQPRMTDFSFVGDARPMPLAEVQSLAQPAYFGRDRRVHGPKISDLLLGNQATYCYRAELACFMAETPSISEILARNLAAAMRAAGLSQPALYRLSGIKQRTISLYLRPADRIRNSTQVPPSPTLERVSQLAAALRIEPWMLLHPNPELAQRAQEVVNLATDRRQPQTFTLHEPEARYTKKKRRPKKTAKAGNSAAGRPQAVKRYALS